MNNEIILISNLVLIYGMVLLWFYLFGSKGLLAFTSICTIAANIEVMILVRAFGMEQTLGNVLFAATFLITDILSETTGKKEAQRAVNIGILTSISFILISQSWLLYTPSANDWAFKSIRQIFSNTPRMMFISLLVYAVTQKIDVLLYHKLWAITEKCTGDCRKFLWMRNNVATLVSQFLNVILFTFGAFYGTYKFDILINIIFSSYIIFIITSLADTPVLYLARRMNDRKLCNKGAVPK